ncbi:MAG: hypothetical protein WBB68_00360 [Candidatus Moraniibacteriota bacterium]
MSEYKLSNSRDYFIAALVGVVLTVFLGVYLLLRRGYVFAAPVSAGALYVPNKVLAGVAVVLIGLSFLVGPLTRYFNRFDSWLNYRKEIGIVGGLFGILHGLVSVFLIPEKFTLEGLFSSYSFGTTIAGLIALLIFAALIVISYQAMIKRIGGVRWWFLQRWGIRIGVAALAYHVIAMKWVGWVKWFQVGVPKTPELANPWMAPASLLVTLFLVWVVLIRLYEAVFLFRSLGWSGTREISNDVSLLRRGRRFVQYSLMLLIGAYAVVVFRWMV